MTLDSRVWTIEFGLSTLDGWTLDCGPWPLDSRLMTILGFDSRLTIPDSPTGMVTR